MTLRDSEPVTKKYAKTVLPPLVILLGGLTVVTSFPVAMIPVYLVVGTVAFFAARELEGRMRG